MRRSLKFSFAFASGLAIATGQASAGDPDGNFMLRVQGAYVYTNDHTKSATSSTLGDIKALGFEGRVTNEYIPAATLSYFFTRNVAVELFCCFAKVGVDLRRNGNTLGEIANTWIFPPALTAQYHFTGFGAFKPYVGVGAQWIHYFSSGTGDNFLKAGSTSFSDSFGPTIQAGLDIHLGDGWYLNADIKQSWLDTKLKFGNAQTLGPHNVEVKHRIDPTIVSIGVGYRFDLFGRRDEPLK